MFVANASHELRTPLTFIRASTEVALRGLRKNGKYAELLDDVLNECDHMSKLIEDLLLLSRLDSGQLAFERQRLSLRAALDDVERQMARLAAKKGVALVNNAAHESVWADPPAET